MAISEEFKVYFTSIIVAVVLLALLLGWLAEWAREELTVTGLAVSTEIREGELRRVLTEEARAWDAHCIFIDSRGWGGADEVCGLGRVAAGLLTGAHCSVEVVR